MKMFVLGNEFRKSKGIYALQAYNLESSLNGT